MFFEALGIECRKTTCDVTKVTYYMYSYDTCYMSRERRKWMAEIVQSVKNPRLEDMDGIKRMFNE